MAKTPTDLTQGPLWRRLLDLAVPAAIGMTFSTLYNVVDVFYAGMISTDAQAGMAISFQIFMLFLAFGIGLGTAMSALVGNALGEKNMRRAGEFAGQGLAAAVMASCMLIVLAMLIAPTLMRITSEPGTYRDLGLQYFGVLIWALPAFVLAFGANGSLQAQGDTVSMQRAMIAAFFANLALNPLFVFGIPGVWNGFGFDGIAVATLSSQAGVAAFVIWRLSLTDLFGGWVWSNFRPDFARQRDILAQQIPSASAMFVMIVTGFVVQFYLKSFGGSAVAAYGVALRVEQVFLLPVFGLTGALLPVIAQAYGAGDHARARQGLWVCFGMGLAYMALASPALLIFARVFMEIFSDDPDVIDIGVSYLRIDGLILPVYMALFAINAFLQALKTPGAAFWIGVYRQAIGVPLFVWVWVEVFEFGVLGVWLGIASAVVTGVIVALCVAERIARPRIGSLWRKRAA